MKIIINVNSMIPEVHKKKWFNNFIENPNGYLPNNFDIETIKINFSRKIYLNVGPLWIRHWEFTFFISLIFFSLIIKIIFKIR